MQGNFRRMRRDFCLQLQGLHLKSRAASFDLIVQTLQLNVQWPQKIPDLMDLLPYLFEMIVHKMYVPPLVPPPWWNTVTKQWFGLNFNKNFISCRGISMASFIFLHEAKVTVAIT